MKPHIDHTQKEETDRSQSVRTLKRTTSVSVEELQQSVAHNQKTKKHKPAYNFMAPLNLNFPVYSRKNQVSSLIEVDLVESENKNRFYLTPINEEFIIEPDRSYVTLRSVKDLKEVRKVRLGDFSLDVSVCKMIPGRANAIAGDERGNLYYINLEEGVSRLIDCCQSRGGVLDLAFSTPTRFLVVGENKQCNFYELEGSEVRRLADQFQDCQLIRKTTFLDQDRFVAGESFHNLRIFDIELLRVSRKIPTESSVYSISRVDRNRFCYGGSNNEISYYDCRAGRLTMSLTTQQNWTGVIRHLSEFSVMYSDWRTVVLADIRKGELARYQTKSKSGIWDAHAVSPSTLLTSSSDCRIVKLEINY